MWRFTPRVEANDMFHYLNIRPSLSFIASNLVLLPSALLQVFPRYRDGSCRVRATRC